jgi:hypothetical protein
MEQVLTAGSAGAGAGFMIRLTLAPIWPWCGAWETSREWAVAAGGFNTIVLNLQEAYSLA